MSLVHLIYIENTELRSYVEDFSGKLRISLSPPAFWSGVGSNTFENTTESMAEFETDAGWFSVAEFGIESGPLLSPLDWIL